MKHSLRFLAVPIVAAAFVTAGCNKAPSGPPADTIYFGGPIITVNDAQPSAEAVAVKDGKIVAVGSRAQVERAQKGANTQMIDLTGKTLIPGFVDAHGHIGGVGMQAVSANLLPPPDGPATSIPQIQQILREHMTNSPFVKQYGMLIGFNYDDSQLAEKRAPTRQELDAVSTEIPVFVIHQSGHLSAYNSKALANAGITAQTPNPEGGVIQREADGKTPNGVMEENAHYDIIYKSIPKFTLAQAIGLIEAAQDIYAQYGFTTAQDGSTDPASIALFDGAAKAGKLKLDVVLYPNLVMNAENPALSGPLMSRTYSYHLRIGGVKLLLDGSPQGKTAWFTKPYFKAPAGQKPDYRGYPTFAKDADVNALVTTAFRNKWQVLAHCNGDAAIDQFIGAMRSASAVPGEDRRPVLIHGNFMRADQIAPLKELGIFPSLFPMHTFYWGDWHRESVVGPARAENISPTGWMMENNMKFTIHHDAPVTFPNSMRVLETAVNRTTRSGYVLGPKQRIEPLVALKAMTIWSAYQHFEEGTKGSIEVGKLADLVILDKNPLTVDPKTIKDIKIVETIKEGTTIYKAR